MEVENLRPSNFVKAPSVLYFCKSDQGMPKKVDKIIDKVRGCKKVSMSIKNGQRWTYLKKHLGFVSDDELFDYLLDLADSIDEPDKKSSCENIQCTEEIDGQSGFIQNVDSLVLHRNLQRRCTRKFNVDDFSKTVCSEKSENVSNSLQNIGKVNKQEVKAFPKSCLEAAETKPYKNKSKCHRVKHKRKRQKTNNVNISATTSDKIILEKTLEHGSENTPTSNHSEVSSESMIDRSVTQFSKGSDDTHENNNIELPLDGKFENNSQYELETIEKQRENEGFLSCEKLSDSCQIERQESKTTAFIEETNQVLVDQISSTCESDDERHNKTTEMTTRFKVSTMSQNDKTTYAHTDIIISPLVDAKSVYSTKDIKSSTETLMPVVELCRNCNVRHSQVLCPLMEPDCMIEDSISLFDWINKYKNNYEVTKVIDLNDPMSRGYSNGTNYNFESNEETIKENKVKDDMQCEEKQENIHPNWPFFSRESLPSCLELKISNMDHGLGVFTKNQLPMYTQFGPLVGQIVQEMDIPDDYSMRHIWEVSTNDKTQYISTTNPLRSNWIRYIRPSETEDSKNINIVKKSGKLFIITCKMLIAGTELIYWPDSHSNPWTRKNKMDKTNCGGCNLKFAHPIYYRLHCCIFHDTNYSLTIRKYHCKVCGTAVLGKDNIMKHAAQSHAGRGAYQCQYCKKFFLRLNYLEMHRTYGCSKNPLRSRPLCDFCGRKFCQPQKLKVHIKRMHSDTSEVLEEFQCKLCTKLLGSRAALQRHMKEVHHKDVVGAAACDRCGKTFQNKSNLKIHMLTHSGVKPFKCKEIECKAAFTTKQCLQFHYKKVHGLNDEMMPKIERSIAYTFDAYSGGLVEDLGRGKIPKFNANEKEECNNVLDIDDDCSDKGSHDALIIKSSRRMKKRKKKAMKEVSLNAKNKLEMVESSVGSIETNLMDTHGPACTTTEVIDKINERLSNKLDTESTLALNPESFNIDNIQSNGQENEEAPSTYQIPTDDDEKLGMSSCKRQESYNASLLVEAALDAAERDIGVVSIPSLEDNEHQGNADLYSGPSELAFKVADFQVAHESTAANVDSFVNDELVMSSATISNTRHVPPINGQCRSSGYAGTPMRLHSIEQYLEQEILTSPRYDEVAHFHANSNFQMLSQAHRLTIDPASGDESDSAVQNLSLSVKDKSIQQMEISKYNYEPDYNSTTNKSRVKFEPVAIQSAREQGLDMSARGFQTSPEPQMQNSNHLHHYHHHHHHHHNHNPYKIDENERHGVDLSLSGSCVSPSYATIYPPYSHVDVSRVVNLEPTSRSHQLHTAVSRIIASPLPETLLTSLSTDSSTAEVRILPSSASPVSTYNTSYSIGTTYHPTRSGYHYCNYY